MENASKALVIAAGVLLGIMVLSMGVLLRATLQGTADTYTATLDANEIKKYNSNFTVFEGREDITPQEIVTVVSIARETNRGTKVSVKVSRVEDYADIVAAWTSNFEINKTEFLRKNITCQYRCDSIEDDDGLVTKIRFINNKI